MRKPLQQRLLERLESGRLMSCCSDPPPPPDLSGVTEGSIEVAKMAQQIAREQLAWAREQDSMNRETLQRVLNVQLPAMEDQARFAREDRARYEQMFQPLEDALVKEAESYASPERMMQERSKAIATVNSQFDAQRRNALQRLESYGVDPSQTRNAALDIGVRTQQAAAQAAAAQKAGENVQNVGRALRSEAINIGRGYPGQVAGQYAGAQGAGSAAVTGGAQTTGAGVQAAGSAIPFMNTAMGGFGQAGNLMNAGYQNQMAGWQAKQDQTMNLINAASGIAGMAMMADGGPAPTRAIPFMADGHVPHMGMGDGSGIDDTVPAKLSEGEYVIPADVVKAKGTEFFDKLLERYHTPAAQQAVA